MRPPPRRGGVKINMTTAKASLRLASLSEGRR
jgi:hypothetical protein